MEVVSISDEDDLLLDEYIPDGNTDNNQPLPTITSTVNNDIVSSSTSSLLPRQLAVETTTTPTFLMTPPTSLTDTEKYQMFSSMSPPPSCAPPLFTDTKWIHFTAEHSLSYEFPVTRMLPCNGNVTFKNFKGLSPSIKHILFTHGFSEAKGLATPSITWTHSPIRVDDIRHFQGHQKINHFIKIRSITRKDCLCENIQRMQVLKGFRHFDFIPKTFVLPREKSEFEEAHRRCGGMWIVKPATLSRGRGITLVNGPRQINVKGLSVVSRYIDNPFCINGLKFDLRLYVLITSFNPLRIYLYEEGLGRFASVPYRNEPRDIKNLSMHLTNYSFNKDHSDYVLSTDPNRDDIGNKWSSSAIFRYLKDHGHDVNKLMMAIEDVIIKTVIAGEMPVISALHFQPYHGNCFELLGFDILLDSNLKPWVLEVNLSPSLNCDTPLDLKIKMKLIADTFSLVGVALPDEGTKKRSTESFTRRSQTRNAKYKPTIPDPYHKFRIGSKFEETSVLVQAKGEHRRRGGYVRIFPTRDTWELYSSFLENTTKLNYLLHRNLYPENGRIKWPPTGISRGVSLRLSNSFSYTDARRYPLKPPNAAGLDSIHRSEIYLSVLNINALSTARGYELFCNGFPDKNRINNDLRFKCIISVYLSKLSQELQLIDTFEYSFNKSQSIEKLLNSLGCFLKAFASNNKPGAVVVVPDHFLSLSLRFRMLIQQLREVISVYNTGITSYATKDERDATVRNILENFDLADIETMIVSHNSSEAFLQNLVELVKCMQFHRHCEETSVNPEEMSSHYSSTVKAKEPRHSTRKLIARKCRAVSRPQSVSPVPLFTSPSALTRRGGTGSVSENDSFNEQSYKSLPCKLQTIDSDLCEGTNRVISAALQRLSTRQLTSSKAM